MTARDLEAARLRLIDQAEQDRDHPDERGVDFQDWDAAWERSYHQGWDET